MKAFLLIFLSIWISFSFGQVDSEIASKQEYSNVNLIFDQHNFGEDFAVLAISEDDYDYYAIDLTKLEDKFARVYFMNTTYEDNRIINLDADLDKDQTWFKAYYTHNEEEIICLFSDLKEKTEKVILKMSDSERADWMSKFNKFKDNKAND